MKTGRTPGRGVGARRPRKSSRGQANSSSHSSQQISKPFEKRRWATKVIDSLKSLDIRRMKSHLPEVWDTLLYH